MKLLKFTAILIVLLVFILGVMGMSFYTGYQYAKAKYIPQIDELQDAWQSMVYQTITWQQVAYDQRDLAEMYKSGAEGWALSWAEDTEVLKGEISTLKQQLSVKPREIVVPLEDWNSLDELKAFLKEDDTDSHLYIIATEDGTVSFEGVCRNQAEHLREMAEAIGKRLETESLTRTEAIMYFDIGQELKPWGRHDICKARIGNEMWFVEPGTDKIFLAYYIPY